MPVNKVENSKPSVHIPLVLQKRLENIYAYPLIVLQASSGYGKTTVINEYLSQMGEQNVHCYTCMGEALQKSWYGISRAFSHINSAIGKQLEMLEYPTRENLVDIAEIISACRVEANTWLIIDNFQYIQGELPKHFLEILSSHNCLGLHIVVITQTIDSLDMRGISIDRGLIVQNDAFFFQKQDTEAYFRANQIVLSKDELDEIQILSEGWVAVLNLQLIRYLQEGDFEASESIDTLIRTVIWDQLEVHEQYFLMNISLLGRFTLKQAYIILGKDTLPDGIIGLLRSGSFLNYERHSGVYTLHSLLQNFLKMEIKGLSSHEILKMQKKVADAYVEVGERYYALCSYLKAGEWEALLSLELTATDFSLYPRDTSAEVLEELLKKCDREIIVRHPQTLSMITFQLFRAGSYAAFGKGYSLMNEMIVEPEKNGLNDEKLRILTGQLVFLQSFVEFNDIEKMSALHRKAWEVLGGPFSNSSDWNDSWTFGQPSVLYLFWSKSGGLARQLACMDECLPYYIHLTEGHGTGADCAMRAEALLMSGEDIASEAMCHKAIYLASSQGQDSICISAEMTILRIALLRGDSIAFKEAKQSILKRVEIGSEPSVKRMVDLSLSFATILAGEDLLPKWLKDLDQIRGTLYDVTIPFGVLTYLRWLLPRKQDAKLIGIAQGLIPVVEHHNFILPQVYFHLFIAIAYHRLGQKKESELALDRALFLALPDEIYLPFAEYGEIIAPLIKSKVNQTGVAKLITLCGRQNLGAEKIRKSNISGHLTPREGEIAHLAAGGLTNREIGSRLHISQETVKAVMKSIFQKLDIHSRVQLQDLKDAGKI